MQPQTWHGLINREIVKSNTELLRQHRGSRTHPGNCKQLFVTGLTEDSHLPDCVCACVWVCVCVRPNPGVYLWVIPCIHTQFSSTVLVFIYVWEWLRVLFYVPTLPMTSSILSDNLHSPYFARLLPAKRPPLLPAAFPCRWFIISSQPTPQGTSRESRRRPGNSSNCRPVISACMTHSFVFIGPPILQMHLPSAHIKLKQNQEAFFMTLALEKFKGALKWFKLKGSIEQSSGAAEKVKGEQKSDSLGEDVQSAYTLNRASQ